MQFDKEKFLTKFPCVIDAEARFAREVGYEKLPKGGPRYSIQRANPMLLRAEPQQHTFTAYCGEEADIEAVYLYSAKSGFLRETTPLVLKFAENDESSISLDHGESISQSLCGIADQVDYIVVVHAIWYSWSFEQPTWNVTVHKVPNDSWLQESVIRHQEMVAMRRKAMARRIRK